MCFINKWLLYSGKWTKTQWHSRSLAFVSKRRWGLTGFWAMRALWYMSFWRGCSSLKIYHLRPFFLRMWISTQKIWFDRVRRLCLETLINSPSPRDSRFTWPNCSAADPNKPSNKMKVQQILSIYRVTFFFFFFADCAVSSKSFHSLPLNYVKRDVCYSYNLELVRIGMINKYILQQELLKTTAVHCLIYLLVVLATVLYLGFFINYLNG